MHLGGTNTQETEQQEEEDKLRRHDACRLFAWLGTVLRSHDVDSHLFINFFTFFILQKSLKLVNRPFNSYLFNADDTLKKFNSSVKSFYLQ